MGIELNNEQFLPWVLNNFPQVLQLNPVCRRYRPHRRAEAVGEEGVWEVEAYLVSCLHWGLENGSRLSYLLYWNPACFSRNPVALASHLNWIFTASWLWPENTGAEAAVWQSREEKCQGQCWKGGKGQKVEQFSFPSSFLLPGFSLRTVDLWFHSSYANM